jgi:hypothetical protein
MPPSIFPESDITIDFKSCANPVVASMRPHEMGFFCCTKDVLAEIQNREEWHSYFQGIE